MAFRLQKANYDALRKMSLGQRLQMASDESMGVWLLSLMTPTQIAELFPRYYRDILPNISGFTKAMPTSMTAARQAAIEKQLANTVAGAKGGRGLDPNGWQKEWVDGMTPWYQKLTRRGSTPEPELTPEQKANWQLLKKGPLSSDDPSAKMFSGLTDAQLERVGVSKYSENGKKIGRAHV